MLQSWERESNALQCLPPSCLLLLMLADVCMHAAVAVWYASTLVYASDACVAVGSVHNFVVCAHMQYDKSSLSAHCNNSAPAQIMTLLWFRWGLRRSHCHCKPDAARRAGNCPDSAHCYLCGQHMEGESCSRHADHGVTLQQP